MAEGRTTYWPKDAAWWRRERNVMLGTEFGAAGPAVIDWLSCEADAQRDNSRVKTGYLAIAKGTFITDVQQVKQIIHRAVEIGALDDFEPNGQYIFAARVSGLSKDRERANAARRQANKRALHDDVLSRPVTHRNGQSQNVTPVTEDAETRDDSEAAGALTLAVIEPANNGGSAPQPGATASKGDSAALSRPVTQRHTRSRPVTESHVKTRPTLKSTTPPHPPASGGRRRDREQAQHEYDIELAAFLEAHPCVHDAQQLEEWQAILERLHDAQASFTLTFLDGSHPHAHPGDGMLMIGVNPAAWRWVQKRLGSSKALDALCGGRRVEFLPCPSLERNAA